MGLTFDDFRILKKFPWAGKYFNNTNDFYNLVKDSEADKIELVVPGKAECGTSFYRGKNQSAVIFNYPYSDYWDRYARQRSTLVEYTSLRDELRAHPHIPGLYVGVMYIKERAWLQILDDEPFEACKFALMQG